jgi:hypothetical protein
VATKGKNKEIDAKHTYFTEQKAKAFGHGLELTEARKVGMVSDHISPRGGLHIIKSLSSHILELNLENNMIGKGDEFIEELVKQI